MAAFSRILLKLSGEILRDGDDCFAAAPMAAIATAVRSVHDSGVQVGIVVGGGNLIRGRDHAKTDEGNSHVISPAVRLSGNRWTA